MTYGFDTGLGSTYTRSTMRRLSRVLVAAMLVSLPAYAQDEGGGASAQEETDLQEVEDGSAQPSALGARSVASQLLQDADKVPDEQKRERSELMVRESREALAREMEILSEARAAKDIVQLNCVNDKITPTKGLVRKIEQASIAMFEALANGQRDVANLEYTKQTLAHPKVLTLKTQAEQCVGYASVYTGDTIIEVDIDPDMAQVGDPTETPLPPVAPVTPEVASAS